MAECKPASEGSNIESSCEKIIAEFTANGRPAGNNQYGSGGSDVLGGFEVKTPRVGTGFIEWAIKDYDIEGRNQHVPEGVDYSRRGDWLYDKEIVVTNQDSDDGSYKK